MTRVYVLLVNWNGWADTLECLESLFRLDYPNVRVIVCDNGSTDNSLVRVRQWAAGELDVNVPAGHPLRSHSWPTVAKPIDCVVYDRDRAESGGVTGEQPRLVLLDVGENLGFAGGNNVGLRYIMARNDFDYVWLLNNDTVVAPNALSALVDRMREKPEAGICGSTLLRYDAPQKVQARGGGWYCKWIGLPWHLGQLGAANGEPHTARVERWMNYVVGASMLVSKAFLREVGLMCEDYFLYFEELDWAIRGHGRYQLAYASKSTVYHKIGSTIGTSSNPAKKSIVCDYYNVRNRIYFTRKFYPSSLPTIYFMLLITILGRIFLLQWGRVAMIFKICISNEISLHKVC